MTGIQSNSLLAKAQKYCAAAEKCEQEVARKLRDWGSAEEEIPAILEQLRADHFVDDERYVFAFVRDKWKFHRWGKIKLRYELENRKLPALFIDRALAEIKDVEYLSVLRSIISNKTAESQTDLSYASRLKLASSLTVKGFEPELVMEILELQTNN